MKKYITNIGICVTSILSYLGIGIVLSLFIQDNILLTTIADIIISILGSIYYKKFIYKKDRSVKSDKNTWFNVLWITIIIWIVTQITVTWYYNTFGDILLDNRNNTISNNTMLYIVLTLFMAPITEEILIRGIVYSSLKKICKTWIAAFISAFIFAILHGTVVHLIIGIYCGLYFLFVYEYTGKLRYAILSHMIYNFLSIGFSDLRFPDWVFTSWFVIISNIALIIIFIKVSLYLAQRKVANDTSTNM